MKATETNFLKFLQGTKQFVVPIYQRKYSWTVNQCRQLWNDIVRAGSNEEIRGHFVGSVVYIEKRLYQTSAVPQLLLIDGQQRMTTLTLLLHALGKSIQKSEGTFDTTKKKIMNYYLVNNEEEDDLFYKLVLTEGDKETLFQVISEGELPKEYSLRVYENYMFFIEQIEKSKIDLNKLYQGIAKLIVVDIALDRDYDDPQLIFESLNSTGLDLSQADLIRNYVLMKLEPKEQTDLYKNYWQPMEKSFDNLTEPTLFDRFMRDYLTVKMGKIPNIKNVYVTFKDYILSQQEKTMHEIVADLYKYAKYFVKLSKQVEEEKDINSALKDVGALKMDVINPMLLEVYDDYEMGLIGTAEFVEILRTVESYLFRRAICGIPTNSLNKTFANLMKEIDKNQYIESLKATLLLKDSYKRFPDNEEFIRELMVKDVYNFRNRNYLLRRLENQDRKEIVDIESYTIEHVMPQNKNLLPEWRTDLGEDWEEIQKTLLHTLGNLTLTRYNSELSDRPFLHKRDLEGGFADSPLRLNRSLSKLNKWDSDSIKERAKLLANEATKVWGYPMLPEEVLSKYKEEDKKHGTVVYTLDDYPQLTGEMLELFNELRKRICNLDSSVKEEFKKHYIAYKVSTNFVDVTVLKSKLIAYINVPFTEIIDPKNLCRDVSKIGRWGNGDSEATITSLAVIEDVMDLIKQAFERQMEE